MSLIPLIWDDHYERPSRLLGQHFGLGMDVDDDIFSPTVLARSLLTTPRPQPRWSVSSAINTVDDDKFQVNVDVQQFAPDEITVKVDDEKNEITVEGRHEEKPDEHGYISRHFVRRYVLPKGHDVKNIHSNLSSDGVLTIVAPKIKEGEPDSRVIPIQQTGRPFKSSNRQLRNRWKSGNWKHKQQQQQQQTGKRNPRHK